MPDSEQTPQQQETAAAAPPPQRKRVSIFKDPVVRALTYASAGLVILYLITIVSALVMGVLTPSAPRTRVERDVRVYESVIAENPADPTLWRRYISALIASGQTTAAEQVIERALEAVDESSSQEITAAQAELLVATGSYEESLELADTLRKRLKTYYDEAKEKEGSDEQRGAEIHDNYWTILLLKAEALVKLERADEAIEALDIYLEERPAAADVLVRRGNLKAEADDKEGAEADFRAALQYLPGDAAALEGLKSIGVEE